MKSSFARFSRQSLMRGLVCLSLGLLPCACSTYRPVEMKTFSSWDSGEHPFWVRVAESPPGWIPASLPYGMPTVPGEWIVDKRDGSRFFVPSQGAGGLSAKAIRLKARQAVKKGPKGRTMVLTGGGTTYSGSSGEYESTTYSSDWSSSSYDGGYYHGHGHHHGHGHGGHGHGNHGGGGHGHGSGGGGGGGHDHGSGSGGGGGHNHGGGGGGGSNSGGGGSNNDSSSSRAGIADREPSSSSSSSSKEGMADKHR